MDAFHIAVNASYIAMDTLYRSVDVIMKGEDMVDAIIDAMDASYIFVDSIIGPASGRRGRLKYIRGCHHWSYGCLINFCRCHLRLL